MKIFLIFLCSLSAAQALLCPDPPVPPCGCIEFLQAMSCNGDSLTQLTLNQFFASLRKRNGVGPTDWLDILFDFTMEQIPLETLDLTPLFYSRFRRIDIHRNRYLHSIKGPNRTRGSHSLKGPLAVPLIGTPILSLQYNNLTDEGITNLLTLFEPSITVLSFEGNKIKGGKHQIPGSGEIEFLPGISRFTNLTDLYLGFTNVTNLGGGQFKRNNRIRLLDLAWSGLNELQENSFLINFENQFEGKRTIHIYGNPIGDEKIDPRHGLDGWKGQVILHGSDSKFEYLSAPVWESFLLANDRKNEGHFRSNLFYCDKQMAWLREGKEIYEGRVFSVICDNDPDSASIFATQIELGEPRLKCPAAETIAPCTCSRTSSKIACEGQEVNQEHINNLLLSFRNANNIDAGQVMQIFSFTLTKSALLSLDLTPLFFTKFEDILIEANYDLQKIIGTPPLNKDDWKIETSSLSLVNNNLNDEGLGNTLTFFAPNMTTLKLDSNDLVGGRIKIEDGSGDIELLKGLGSLVNLDHLTFDYNKITSLRGGQFKRNSRLSFLSLVDNKLSELQENAFLVNESEEGADLSKITAIYLHYNLLSDPLIHPKHGLDSWKRKEFRVECNSNKFVYLSQESWAPFLRANNHTNQIWFYTNNFFCDERMKWLKEGRVDFENRVHSIYCTNDMGETIFTTQLVARNATQ